MNPPSWWPSGVGGVVAVIVLVADVALMAVGREDLTTGLMIGGLAIARLV